MLHAQRYLQGTRPEYVELIEKVHTFKFEGVQRFYVEILPKLNRNERALLGANDRFFLLTSILDRQDAINPWLYERIREVEAEPDGFLDLWARYHYKDLDSETPVLTTKGWKRHGDLKRGDRVFSPTGKPVKVLAARHFNDSACRRVTFDNCVSLTCGAGHLWTIEATTRKRVSGTEKRQGRHSLTLETDEIRRAKWRFRPVIRSTAPLRLPRANLPIDPYVLGAWLGDGAKSDGRITCGDQWLFAEIERRGYEVASPTPASPITRTIYGIRPKLRALGVLFNKHIPQSYLFGSAAQRLALLQGLIDTDGSVSKVNRCVTFAQKDKAFAESVVTLAASLGFKPRLSPVRSTSTWHVTFQASRAERPCRMPRKLARLDDARRRPGSLGWRVHDIMDVETVPTNCIQVDSEDGLYLVGHELIPTHNSTIITFAGSIEAIIRDPEVTIAIFAATNQIARPFLEQIKEELETNEQLKFLYPDVFWEHPKLEAPTWSKARGIVVKRKTIRKELTVEAYGLVEALPTSRHFDMLIYDDLVTQDLVDNEDVIKKVGLRWEMSDNLGSGATKTRKRMIGTRYSFNDPYNDIIDTGTVRVRLYPATDDGTEHGKPVFISQDDWEDIKRVQRNTYPAQMLQNPLAGKNNTFLGEHLRPYYMRPRTLNVYIMGDPSMGKAKSAGGRSSDRTAIAVIGIDSAGNKYLLDGMCHRMKLSERWENLKRLYLRWMPREIDSPTKGAEGVMNISVGWERYGMQSDLEYFEEKMQDKANPSFKIEELSWTREGDQSKKARVQRLEPDFRENKFYVPAKVWRASVAWADKQNAEIKSGARVCLWAVDDSGAVSYRPIPFDPARGNLLMLTREERQALAAGEGFRLIEPIKRRDEEDRAYDLTAIFFNEYLRFPFAPHDDLIDAMSRIHDMKPTAAEIIERDALEPTVYDYERLA